MLFHTTAILGTVHLKLQAQLGELVPRTKLNQQKARRGQLRGIKL